MTCLPVQSMRGLKMEGGGSWKNSLASVMPDRICMNYFLVKKRSLSVMRYAVVKKSWMSAMMGSPPFGVMILDATPMRCRASLLASSVWGTWIFISSPSKSALKGEHTHSLNLKVFPGDILALKPIILTLCSDGCLLKITISSSLICRSTTSPSLSSVFPYPTAILLPSDRTIKFAPPIPDPLAMHYFKNVMDLDVTGTDIVRIFDMCWGIITWVGWRLGSGDITVRPVKFDRLPDRFCLNRPCLPLSLETRDRIAPVCL